MRLLTSNNQLMMEKSMNFLWAKQQAHLDNITNAETPGYKAKTVTFEERFDQRLRAAAKTGRSRAMIREAIQDSSWNVYEDTETTRMDENGVNVLEQSVEAVRTAYQLQYTYQAISTDLAIVTKAITG